MIYPRSEPEGRFCQATWISLGCSSEILPFPDDGFILYQARPATINPRCPGTVFLRSIPKNHNFSSDSAVRNQGFLWGKGTLAKQTSRKSPFTTSNQQANCWCWTFQTSFWARWGHCGCKRDDFKKVSQTICLSCQEILLPTGWSVCCFQAWIPQKKCGKNRQWKNKRTKDWGKAFFQPWKAFCSTSRLFFNLRLDEKSHVYTWPLQPVQPPT